MSEEERSGTVSTRGWLRFVGGGWWTLWEKTANVGVSRSGHGVDLKVRLSTGGPGEGSGTAITGEHLDGGQIAHSGIGRTQPHRAAGAKVLLAHLPDLLVVASVLP